MEFKNPQTRPQRTSQSSQRSGEQSITRRTTLWKSKHIRWVVFAAVLGFLVGVLPMWEYFTVPRPAADRYQAVFLNNGQTFFGKLKNTGGAYLTLEHVYTTQKQTLPEDVTEAQQQAVSNNVSLVKVSGMVYGPEDAMSIRADQVLFWQDLQPNSKVVQAIEQRS